MCHLEAPPRVHRLRRVNLCRPSQSWLAPAHQEQKGGV